MKRKVLIAEDDQFLSKMYQKKFELSGFEVVVVSNGELAIEKMTEWKPTIVVMDVMMPKLSGFEALKNAKSITSIKNIPIVILTNLGNIEDKEKAMSLGAKDYLVKSELTPAEVVDKVTTLIK